MSRLPSPFSNIPTHKPLPLQAKAFAPPKTILPSAISTSRTPNMPFPQTYGSPFPLFLSQTSSRPHFFSPSAFGRHLPARSLTHCPSAKRAPENTRQPSFFFLQLFSLPSPSRPLPGTQPLGHNTRLPTSSRHTNIHRSVLSSASTPPTTSSSLVDPAHRLPQRPKSS